MTALCNPGSVDSDTPRPPLVLDVTAEGARGRELAELVADHRLRHEHGHVLAAVVHCDRVAQHGRHDHRATGPRLDDVLGALVVLNVDLLHQMVVDERTLFQAAWHSSLAPSAASWLCGGGRSFGRCPCAPGECGLLAFPPGWPGGGH